MSNEPICSICGKIMAEPVRMLRMLAVDPECLAALKEQCETRGSLATKLDDQRSIAHGDITLKDAEIASLKRYIDEYLYPAAKRMNSRDTSMVWECLTFEQWIKENPGE
jgi:hypothetical protein